MFKTTLFIVPLITATAAFACPDSLHELPRHNTQSALQNQSNGNNQANRPSTTSKKPGPSTGTTSKARPSRYRKYG